MDSVICECGALMVPCGRNRLDWCCQQCGERYIHSKNIQVELEKLQQEATE